MVHAAARVAAVLVAQVQLVVLGHKTQPQHPGLELAVARSCAPLAAVRLELVDKNPQRGAGLAAIAIGAIREHAAAAKPLGDQIGVKIALDQVAGGGDLRPCLPVRQVTAGVGRCRVKLQGLQRKVVELRHAGSVWGGSSSSQYTGSNCQGVGGCCRALSTCCRKSARGISRPPREARCCVFCWQSIRVMP